MSAIAVPCPNCNDKILVHSPNLPFWSPKMWVNFLEAKKEHREVCLSGKNRIKDMVKI